MISLRLMWKIGVKTEPITPVLIQRIYIIDTKNNNTILNSLVGFTLLKATEKQTEKKPEVDKIVFPDMIFLHSYILDVSGWHNDECFDISANIT